MSKIVSVEAIPLAYRDPNRPNPDPADREAAYILLVKVVTSDGAVGWGETWTRFAEANRAVVEIVRALEKTLVGLDASGVEALYDRMAQRMYWGWNSRCCPSISSTGRRPRRASGSTSARTSSPVTGMTPEP